MREPAPKSEWTMAEVVTRCPKAACVLARFGMACAGCPMAPFETLAEAAAAYKQTPETLIRELRRVAQESPKFRNSRYRARSEK